ncbi:MAG TPA: ABC-F family ATP-binding cassette domain-containing protein [Candidatus Limnocylindrales bacterium]
MSILRLLGVTREIGTFVILESITASIALGDRIGLVGPNGSGKTTLLRLAAGRDEPDRGDVHRKRGLTLGLLAQEAHFDAAFMASPDLRTAVRSGASHLDLMAERLAAFERDGRVTEPAYAELQHEFELLGGYTLDQRVDTALSGLGFSRDEWVKPPSALSGGEQTRASLARLVIADPDLLLLDEPTNHLDLGALEWLEEHLRRRAGSLLVASHDRAFLDAAVTRVWELRDRRLTVFRGDYSAYHRQRLERDARAVREVETQAESIARERELVQRYRSHRKFSKMHEHESRLERLEAERREAPRAGRRLAIPTEALVGSGPSRSGEIVVRIEGLAVGYLPGRGAVDAEGLPAAEPHLVARVPFLAAQRGERIGIVGPNGAGKTTLLRTIAGDLPPLDGGVTFGNAVQIGYLAQLRDAAIPGETVLDALLEAVPVTAGEARSYLARFLFRGDDAFKEVRSLSGGERSRLELALLGIQASNLLLLDEPTNHLDIPAREAIEAFMATSPATLLVVSHDRRLLETVCDKLWVVDRGSAVPFDGGYRAWRAAIAAGWTVAGALEVEAARLRGDGGRRPPAAGVRDSRASGAASARPTQRVAVAEPAPAPARMKRRDRLSKDAYRRQKQAVEGDLTRLHLRKNHLELAMADPAVAANFVEMRRVTSELADIEVALAAAEDAWLELEERAP